MTACLAEGEQNTLTLDGGAKVTVHYRSVPIKSRKGTMPLHLTSSRGHLSLMTCSERLTNHPRILWAPMVLGTKEEGQTLSLRTHSLASDICAFVRSNHAEKSVVRARVFHAAVSVSHGRDHRPGVRATAPKQDAPADPRPTPTQLSCEARESSMSKSGLCWQPPKALTSQ